MSSQIVIYDLKHLESTVMKNSKLSKDSSSRILRLWPFIVHMKV